MKLKLSAKNIDTAICILSLIVLILTCILFVRKTNSVEGFGPMDQHKEEFEKMSPEEQKKFMDMISKEQTAPGTTPASLSEAEQLALAEKMMAVAKEEQLALGTPSATLPEEEQLALAKEMMTLAKEKQLALGTTSATLSEEEQLILSEEEQLILSEEMSALAEEKLAPGTTPAILTEEEKQSDFETKPTPSVTTKEIPPVIEGSPDNYSYNNRLNNASSLTIENVRKQLRNCIEDSFTGGLEKTLKCVQ